MTTKNRGRSGRLASWVAVGALALGTVGLAAPADAAVGGDITGTVVSATGPLDNVDVVAWKADGNSAGSTSTDPTGHFTLSGLDEGAYRFEFTPNDEKYRSEFYNDVRGFSAATPVTVDAVAHDLGTVTLATNPSISGRVVDDLGNPITGGGWVDAYDQSGDYTEDGFIEPDGTYTVYLEPGSYRLNAYDFGGEHFDAWYRNAGSEADATPVTIDDGQSLTGIDFTLSKSLVAFTPPSVSGTPFVGQTLTADKGKWNQTRYVQFSYQWLRGATAIPGATGRTYALTSADLGSPIAVKVSALYDRPGMKATGEATSAATAAVKLPDIVNSVKPTVTGTAKVGSKLTATPGTWDQADATFAYQWLRNGVAIADATSSTYVLQGADAGKAVSVQVTASKPGFAGGAAVSAPTAKVAEGKLKGVKATIKGTPKVGHVIKARVKHAKGAKVKYQWLRDGKAIKGKKAKKAKYELTRADAGHKLRFKAKVKKKGYKTKTVKSKAVKVTR